MSPLQAAKEGVKAITDKTAVSLAVVMVIIGAVWSLGMLFGSREAKGSMTEQNLARLETTIKEEVHDLELTFGKEINAFKGSIETKIARLESRIDVVQSDQILRREFAVWVLLLRESNGPDLVVPDLPPR